MQIFNKRNLKIALSWVIGIVSLVLISKCFNILLQSIGVPSYIDFGETITVTRGSGRYSYDEDIDGYFTTAGAVFNFLSLMLAVRIGMSVYSQTINDGVSKKGNIDFIAWATGLAIFGAVAAILFKIFNSSNSAFLNFLGNILELCAVGIIFYFCKKWRDKKFYDSKNL